MTCDEVRQQLGALIDDELSPDLRSGIEPHLAGCESCAAEFDELRGLVSSLSPSTSTCVPDDLWASIERGLDGDRSEGLRGLHATRRMVRLP